MDSYKNLIDRESALATLMVDYRLDENAPEKEVAVKKKEEIIAGSGGIIVAEDKESGHVSWDVYWHYFEKCGGYAFCIIAITAALLNSGTQVTTNLWLSWWSTLRFDSDVYTHMEVYGFLGIGQFF